MGSKCRMIQRVRTNPDYKALTGYLDQLRLPHRVEAPSGKGHPALVVSLPTGGEVRYTIGCTPSGRLNAPARVSDLRRKLAAAGVAV